MKSFEVDEKAFESVPLEMANISLPVVLKNIKDNIVKYMPQNTGSLLTQIYLDRDGLDSVIGVGSLVDDEINEVAIKQHETPLNHFGRPGKSMREGMPGTVNYKWISAYRRVESQLTQEQDDIYWKGLREKKINGQLSVYATKYLENATIEASNNALRGLK